MDTGESSQGRLEAECAATERAAASLEQTLRASLRATQLLVASARSGDIVHIRKASESLQELGGAVSAAARNAATAWSLGEAEEEAYLRDGYAAELIASARREGIRIDELEGRLVSFPSIIRLLPQQRAIRIDAKKLTTLNPSTVVAKLRVEQQRKPRLAADRFLESLFESYVYVVGGAENVSKGALLVDVYDVLTLHPDMRKSYDKAEFVRDLYALDSSNVRATKRGFAVRLPAATGTKSARNVLTIVDRTGVQHTYYGIRFLEAE